MLSHHSLSSCVAFALAGTVGLAACGSDSDDPAQPAPSEKDAISIVDANNYSTMAQFAIPTFDVAAGADLDICWGDLEQDLQCHSVDPATQVNNIGLLRFLNLSASDVEAKLASGELAQSEVTGYAEHPVEPGQTCVKLSDFAFVGGTPIDVPELFVESDTQVYMLVFTSGTSPGIGARTMAFLRPLEDATSVEVGAPQGCGILEFGADLSSLEPLAIPEQGPWKVRWHELERDGNGNRVEKPRLDRVLLAFYEGQTIADLEEHIFDIELNATKMWEAPLDNQREVDLAVTRERVVDEETGEVRSGERFAGFETDEEGVWLLGLMCGKCQNPAPVLLTVVEPELVEP